MNEAELLFTDILGCSRTDLILNRGLSLPADKAGFISLALKRRILGEPIEYILGKTEFMGLEFRVNKDVLIPRQETEILIEKVIDVATRSPASPAGGQGHQITRLKVLDIGTGSGNIAVSLAKFISNINITATDISPKALGVAIDNARLNNVTNKIEFIQSDLFTDCVNRDVKYDMIISNPPYISTLEIDTLQREISYEPRMALDGGSDGLNFYRKIIDRAPDHLKEGGILIMEMGFNQCAGIKEIFKNSENFEIIDVVKDYNNIDRVITARKLNG